MTKHQVIVLQRTRHSHCNLHLWFVPWSPGTDNDCIRTLLGKFCFCFLFLVFIKERFLCNLIDCKFSCTLVRLHFLSNGSLNRFRLTTKLLTNKQSWCYFTFERRTHERQPNLYFSSLAFFLSFYLLLSKGILGKISSES